MYEVDYKATGKKLKELRGNKTQEEMGRIIGISQNAWDNYEQGIRIPRDEIKVKIANYFNMSIEALFYCN